MEIMQQKSFADWVEDNEIVIQEEALENDETFDDACNRMYLDYEQSWFELYV
jgi:hypothetical protein